MTRLLVLVVDLKVVVIKQSQVVAKTQVVPNHWDVILRVARRVGVARRVAVTALRT